LFHLIYDSNYYEIEYIFQLLILILIIENKKLGYSIHIINTKMNWPFKDYDYYGNKYVNIQDPSSEFGEIMWYDRNIDTKKTPTECVICIEAENEMFTKYAHPKAHLEAHTHATKIAETLAIKEKNTEEYLNYYTFYYGREYIKIYKELYKKYKEEYYHIVLEKQYDKETKICEYHCESIQYYHEQK
jgi:hypothetical protein